MGEKHLLYPATELVKCSRAASTREDDCKVMEFSINLRPALVFAYYPYNKLLFSRILIPQDTHMGISFARKASLGWEESSMKPSLQYQHRS